MTDQNEPNSQILPFISKFRGSLSLFDFLKNSAKHGLVDKLLNLLGFEWPFPRSLGAFDA